MFIECFNFFWFKKLNELEKLEMNECIKVYIPSKITKITLVDFI